MGGASRQTSFRAGKPSRSYRSSARQPVSPFWVPWPGKQGFYLSWHTVRAGVLCHPNDVSCAWLVILRPQRTDWHGCLLLLQDSVEEGLNHLEMRPRYWAQATGSEGYHDDQRLMRE